jgi:AcrR family transcriptional regulator
VPVEGSLRDRRRAQTVREIKDATLAQLAEAGPGALSLRAVARSVGMTVQSIYHYFDSRDALLTALVADAHRRLAEAVAYREWAITNRAGFLLLYGTPVPGFEPLPDGGTREAALRLATPFLDVVFDGWTAAELTAVPVGRGGEPLAEVTHPAIPLPAGALALFTELRARMHGLVMLELLGHLRPLHGHAPVLYTAAMNRMSDDIDELRRRAAQASFSAR